MPRFSRTTVAVGYLLLAGIFLLVGYSAVLRKSATIDEPLHTAAAYAARFLDDHRIDPENPLLWKYWLTLPLRRDSLRVNERDHSFIAAANAPDASAWSTRTLYQTPGNDGAAVINTARGMMVLIGAAALLLAAWWAHRLAGAAAAIGAAILFALDPTFLAHAPLVKNDVAVALLMLALVIALWSAGRRFTVITALAIALICAAAVNVKFSGLLFPLIALAILALRAMLPQPWRCLRWELSTRGKKLLVPLLMAPSIGIVSFAGIWATYGFRYLPTTDPGRGFNVATIALPPGFSRNAIQFIDRHRLLPQAYSAGFLGLRRAFSMQQNYLLGRIDPRGWWYYFPLAILFKTPLATLAAAGIALALLVSRRLRLDAPARWALLCCTVAAGIYLIIAAMQPINHGIRHMLPIFPLAFIVIAVIFARALVLWKKPATIVAALLALGLGIETLGAYPNYIAFFNIAASQHRLHLLSDSNLDWGQDLPLLADWQKRYSGETLHLAYFGTADPAFYGIDYNNLPAGFFLGPPPQSVTPGGVVAISATRLQGLYMTETLRKTYMRFKGQPPRKILGGTIYLFDYSP